MDSDYASELWNRVEALIESQISRIRSSSRPVLRVEAVLQDIEDSSMQEVAERTHLITVDLSSWRCEENTSTRDDADEQVETVSPSKGEKRLVAPHRRACSIDVLAESATGFGRRSRTGRSRLCLSDPQSERNTSDNLCARNARSPKRRKYSKVAGLRVPTVGALTPPKTPPLVGQLRGDANVFPQRKKATQDQTRAFRPSTLDKLIGGIWENLHGSVQFTLPSSVSELAQAGSRGTVTDLRNGSIDSFREICNLCRQVSAKSRSFRALEVIVQAHWMECFDARVAALGEARRGMSVTANKKLALTEACRDFAWTEKELRNRMSIWRGYLELQEAAGWSAIVFAGAGLYRYCKYRVGFDTASMSKLTRFRSRFEVAADTLQPEWRGLLAVIGQHTRRVYHGHPHDWTVSNNSDPVPLGWTYRHVDSDFKYQHIETSIVDQKAWGASDPRIVEVLEQYTCKICGQLQSPDEETNLCECFSDVVFRHRPFPVQIFRRDDERNNGLLACCAFDRGTVVGEFVGLVTKGMKSEDVLTGQAGSNPSYQIYQGKAGNHTRFVNHSCLPNCQFQSFLWLGIEKILLISKGISAGNEITVDYSGRYSRGLEKECRCGQACCQYQ